MVPSEFILDVNEKSFEFEVLYYSRNIPVLVDFWASWCQPCKQLSPMLENVVTEADGSLRLARVDADANQKLAMQYQVRSLPTVIAFQDGKVVAEFSGLISQDQLDEFVELLLPPSQIDLDLEKGNSLLSLHQWKKAEDVFRSLSQSEDCPPAAILGLAKSLIPQGKSSDALVLLKRFPASKEYRQAEALLPLAADLTSGIEPETDLDAMYANSLRLVNRGNLLSALDGLLEVLNNDKNYRKGKAKFAFLAILELLGDQDPSARDYRDELSLILFK
ncbi:thioredoxin [Leptolinea tardivitalis]|uniref:thioredoxin n=1 Tax=Leptolinea tardivitalis TaxID=229920 RepID=UPI000782953A|nr:thioredoxin [Leptolinea tardivitalis]GAP21200.1 thioredoxin [Leptolinea tardivitalis]